MKAKACTCPQTQTTPLSSESQFRSEHATDFIEMVARLPLAAGLIAYSPNKKNSESHEVLVFGYRCCVEILILSVWLLLLYGVMVLVAGWVVGAG